MIAIAILAAIALHMCGTFAGFFCRQQASLSMQQINTAINYARSMAIFLRQPVEICPSRDKISCHAVWQHGILVIAPNGARRFFKILATDNFMLTLQQSGFSQQRVQVQPDGTTYSNGHFTLKSLNSRYIVIFNLYFNRALRTYERQVA
jgi:Tfp pilus assembly protein FimT